MFCEKPFALNVADAKAAIAACRKAGVALGVGHNRRLWPSIVKLKEVVSSAEFGTVMFAEGNYSHDILANTPLDNWRSAPQETKAGGMTGMGIHLLDAFSFLIGPMARVSALSTRRILPFESGDTTQAMLAFRNGATGTIATSLKTPGFVWRCAVYGSEMWAESLSETKVTICRSDGKPETFDVPQTNHIGANLEFIRRRRARARPSSRSTTPASFTRSRRSKRYSTRRNTTANGATLHDVKMAASFRPAQRVPESIPRLFVR